VLRTAESLTLSLDEIVCAVNPADDTVEPFAARLCTFAPRFPQAAGVICFVPGHHLITSNTIENGMHDGPLGRGFAPAAFSFLPRQFNGPTDAKVAVQFPIYNKHPTHTQSDRAWKPL
jgi:hypothetical protein